MSARIVLVAGPPCGGKTSYVKAHAGPTDIVVDFDDFAEEVGSNRYDRAPEVLEHARRRWFDALDMVRSLESDKTAWVVWSAASGWERDRFRRRFGARAVVLLPSMSECLERAATERPAVWRRYIFDWYWRYSPGRYPEELVMVDA